jgi:type II secretory pathway component GspD/PulD (secretin)
MGRKEDIVILRQVIRQLDVMLAQVLLEALILEVNLNDNISFGVDWLQRSMTAVRATQQGPNGGLAVTEPIFSFGGGQDLGSGDFRDASKVDRTTPLNAGALTYFGTFTDLNIDAVITMAAGDSDAKVLAAPVILTTDNTEASVNVGERRPIPTTTQTATINGSLQSSVEYEDIGINLQIKPRISPSRVVVLEVSQKVDNVGGTVAINGNDIPIITTREFEALVTLTNKTTLVLGGLVNEDTRTSHTKVPLLGDIPILGNLFRSTRETNNRTELMVLLTPHVILSVEDAINETERLHNSTRLKDGDNLNGWSGNSLAEVSDDVDQKTVPMRRYRNRVEQLRADKEEARLIQIDESRKTAPTSTEIRIPASTVPSAEPAPRSVPSASPEPGPVEPQPGIPGVPPASGRVVRPPHVGPEAFRAEPRIAVEPVISAEELARPPLR